jgi:hypothetical protein
VILESKEEFSVIFYVGVISYEGLLMLQVTHQDALTRFLVQKGIFTKKDFWAMGRVINQDMKIKRGWENGV